MTETTDEPTNEPRVKNAPATRGRPFQPGNPGRPAGARNRSTLALEAMLDGEAEGVTRKCVEMALAGDTTALRLVMERILPPRKERVIQVDLPLLESAGGALAVSGALLKAAADGSLTPGEATALAGLVAAHQRVLETHALEARLTELEQRIAQTTSAKGGRP